MLAVAPLLLALCGAAPEDVRLYFRPAPAAERVVVGEVLITPDDLVAGVAVNDDALLRALRVEAVRARADVVLDVALVKDARGRPSVRGTLARERARTHGVRARNGLLLFFAGEGLPPRGEQVRAVEVRADELLGAASPSRLQLIRALSRKAEALGGDAIAMVDVVDGEVRRARGVVVRKKADAAPRPAREVVGRGVPVDEGWYSVPVPTRPAPPAPGDAPPDPADG